ncbi:MAG: GntR family transcriptional regulator [Rhodobacteraceae bacterium]|nr:GntR family transcriptional regulator [Paracoccaceae bacterium]
METPASSSESLKRRAYERLQQEIIAGSLPPGEKLTILKLTQRFDMGATPIREALSQLTSDGLVHSSDGRGFRVAPASRTEFADLLRVRLWIEGQAIAEAIAQGGPDWEDAVLSSNFRLSRCPRSMRDDRFEPNPEWEDLHKRFHMVLLSGASSPIASRLCSQLYDQNVRYRSLAGASAYPGRSIADEHQALARAVLDRDTALAVALLTRHYTETAHYLQDLIPDAAHARP